MSGAREVRERTIFLNRMRSIELDKEAFIMECTGIELMDAN
jgi:hypothetical protein